MRETVELDDGWANAEDKKKKSLVKSGKALGDLSEAPLSPASPDEEAAAAAAAAAEAAAAQAAAAGKDLSKTHEWGATSSSGGG